MKFQGQIAGSHGGDVIVDTAGIGGYFGGHGGFFLGIAIPPGRAFAVKFKFAPKQIALEGHRAHHFAEATQNNPGHQLHLKKAIAGMHPAHPVGNRLGAGPKDMGNAQAVQSDLDIAVGAFDFSVLGFIAVDAQRGRSPMKKPMYRRQAWPGVMQGPAPQDRGQQQKQTSAHTRK